MGSLQRIADALDTTAVQLLATAEAPRPVDVVRGASASVRETGAEGGDGRMRPLVRGHQRLHALEFTGDHDWGREFRHRNDEILYVADGGAEVEADGSFYRLERGDTLYCAAWVSSTAGARPNRAPGSWWSASRTTSRRRTSRPGDRSVAGALRCYPSVR